VPAQLRVDLLVASIVKRERARIVEGSQSGSAQLWISSSVMEAAQGDLCLAQNSQPIICAI
jgi:hypothetical protein